MIRPKISRGGRRSRGGPVGPARRLKPLFHLSSRITSRARLVIRSASFSTLFLPSISKISEWIIANCRTALFSYAWPPVWTLLKSRSRIAASPSSTWTEPWPAPRETAWWRTLKNLWKFRLSRYLSLPGVSSISNSFYYYYPTNVFYLVMGQVIVMGHFQFTLSQVQKYQYPREYEINHAETLLIGRQ